MTTSLHNRIHMQGKNSFFWTGLISLFTSLLCNSHQYFHCFLKVFMIQNVSYCFTLSLVFMKSHYLSIISSFHSTLCFLHVSSLMCLLISQTYSFEEFTSTLNHILQEHNSHSISFSCKIKKDKVVKGTYL